MLYEDQLKDAQPALSSFVRSRVFNHQDAMDVLQDINAVVLNKEGSYDKKQPFEGWVIGIAKYQILNYFKRTAKRQTSSLDYSPEPFLEDIPFAHIVREEREALCSQIREILTPQQKKIFHLLCLGCSTQQIATQLNLTHGTVNTSKHRLIQRAKRYLIKLNLLNKYDYRSNR